MWIRTQDRKNLCEVKNKIGIIHDDEDTEIPIGIFLWDSSLTMLGEYLTKERALEVIDEIEDIFVNYKPNHPNSKIPVYEMPLE
jgi:hypothetical protein